MRKPSARTALGLAAVAAVLCLAFWGSRKQSPFYPATPISSTADWHLEHGNVFSYNIPSNEPYLWLTDHEVFHFKGDKRHGFRPVSFNTRTQTEQPEPGLTAVQKGYVISASPDGQWVLWNTTKNKTFVPGMAATRRADGKTIRRIFQIDHSEGIWLPDSRRWVGIVSVPTGKISHGSHVSKNRIAVFSVDRPGMQTFSMPANRNAIWILGVDMQGHVIQCNSCWGGLPGKPFALVESALDPLHPTMRQFQVPQPQMPLGATNLTTLSPQGDRLLWSNVSEIPPVKHAGIIGWLYSQMHHSAADLYGTKALDIWVSRLDGSVPIHIGTWPTQDLTSVAPVVQWNPDGKHVSMIIDQILYSVPVG